MIMTAGEQAKLSGANQVQDNLVRDLNTELRKLKKSLGFKGYQFSRGKYFAKVSGKFVKCDTAEQATGLNHAAINERIAVIEGVIGTSCRGGS